MNTQENNILIAELEGKKIITANEFNKLGEQAYTGENKDVDWGIVEYLDYHKNWNSLMPVVEKMHTLGYGTSITGGSKGYATLIHIPNNMFKSIGISHEHEGINSPLKATYKAVIEFIKWYNKQ